MHKRLALLFLTVSSIIPLSVSGQKQVNSPFSRFNLGILEPAGSFRSLGMGGTGTAIRDNSSIFFSNPASYSSIDTNSFIFDFGVDYGWNLLSDGESHHSSGDMNFDHLLMGFPVSRKIGVATGLYNLSNGYYKISESGNDPIAGGYSSYHAGSGGLTSFFLGSGISITKNISAGVNMSLLFGSVRRTNELDFDDYSNVYHDNITETLQITGLNFDYGLQYTTPLKKNYFINAGVAVSTGKHYKSSYENLAFRFTAFGGSDTIPGGYQFDDTTRAYIPGTLRMGLAFGKKNKLTASVDMVMTKWSKAKFHDSEGHLGNTKGLYFGAEYIPEKYSNYSFLKRLEYRIGGHVEDNYLVLNGIQAKEFGASCGLGIPMRILSKTNLFFDFTRKSYSGTTFSHYENYFTFGISLNLHDWWFIKPKYD
jgi:hypothetical protein